MPIIRKEGNFRLEKKKISADAEVANIFAVQEQIDQVADFLTDLQPFSSGTKMVFYQDSAPLGWTSDSTSYNYPTIKIVNDGTISPTWSEGTGGTHPISDPPSTYHNHGSNSGSYTIAFGQMGIHKHTITGDNDYSGNSRMNKDSDALSESACCMIGQGGGGSHRHSIPPVTVDEPFEPKYLDVIIAVKD